MDPFTYVVSKFILSATGLLKGLTKCLHCRDTICPGTAVHLNCCTRRSFCDPYCLECYVAMEPRCSACGTRHPHGQAR